jgi:16S rRNA (adenine1518-N6/adenine1519-N6)-dimethyltransferase
VKDFQFLKRFGQNFLTDTNLLRAIAADAGVTGKDTVLEIGAGAGALTAALCEKAGRVVAYEIDTRLESILNEKLAGFDNYELRFKDFLKENKIEYFDKVVANLPYYITAPVIFKLIEFEKPPECIVVMVQEEVADRLCAKAGTKDYGAITASVALTYRAEITRRVSRSMFVPRPNVDSAVVKLTNVQCTMYNVQLVQKARKVIKAAFSMRRKTLANNLTAGLGINKERAEEVLRACKISPQARGETLYAQQFLDLAGELL